MSRPFRKKNGTFQKLPIKKNKRKKLFFFEKKYFELNSRGDIRNPILI